MLTHAVFQHGTAHVMNMIGTIGQQSLWVGHVPEGIELPAKFISLAQDVKAATGALVIGVQQETDESEVLNPPDDLQLHSGVHLIYLAVEAVLPEVE